MDVTLATCALVVAAPVLLVIAVAIKLDSPGPVFFRQERIGRAGKPFRIFKFRSMTADAWQQRDAVAQLNEVDGPLFKMENDPRVTRVGAFIRKTSLDELPQLINVVRGEMSLVGPRPLPTEESDRIDGAALARLDVKPGHHRTVAGLRSQRPDIRRPPAPRLGVRPLVVADVGSADHGANTAGCVRTQRRVLTFAR